MLINNKEIVTKYQCRGTYTIPPEIVLPIGVRDLSICTSTIQSVHIGEITWAVSFSFCRASWTFVEKQNRPSNKKKTCLSLQGPVRPYHDVIMSHYGYQCWWQLERKHMKIFFLYQHWFPWASEMSYIQSYISYFLEQHCAGVKGQVSPHRLFETDCLRVFSTPRSVSNLLSFCPSSVA